MRTPCLQISAADGALRIVGRRTEKLGLMGDVQDFRFALLDAPDTPAEITIEDEQASIRCGHLTAQVGMDGWHHYAQITFVNQRGEVLLRETPAANALQLRCRKFEPHLGGDFALRSVRGGVYCDAVFHRSPQRRS
jgi:hypothetical protein